MGIGGPGVSERVMEAFVGLATESRIAGGWGKG